jgi:hypothetical protein
MTAQAGRSLQTQATVVCCHPLEATNNRYMLPLLQLLVSPAHSGVTHVVLPSMTITE